MGDRLRHFWCRRDGFGIWILFLLGCMGLPCGGGGPPAPDRCNGSTAGDVATLEVGAGSDEAGRPFVPVSDGGWFPLVVGGQGSPMMAVRLRITGNSPPTCLDQTTTILDDRDRTVANVSVPLTTYAEGNGRMTRSLFVIVPEDELDGTITVSAGGKTLSQRYHASVGDAAVPGRDLTPPADLSSPDLSPPEDLSPTDDLAPPNDLPLSD